VIQLLISPITLWQLYPVRDHLIDHPVRVLVWGVLAVLLMPYVLGTAAAKLESLFFPAGASTPPTGLRAIVAWFFQNALPV
jgi:hypothetical protein